MDTSCPSVLLEGDIEPENVQWVIDEIARLQKESNPKRITLIVSSDGGGVKAGFWLYDHLMTQVTIEIQTAVFGAAGSMAIPIVLAGDHRYIAPHATLFFHEESKRAQRDTTFEISELRATLAEMEMGQNHYIDVLAERSGLSRQKVKKLMRDTTTISAEKALELGFVHEILSELR